MKTEKPVKREPVPCRAVFVLQNRFQGLPLSRIFSPSLDGAVSSDETMLGVGIFGLNPYGKPFARCGIYTFDTATPRFHYAIGFDAESGTPIYRAETGNHSVSESEQALVGWVQSAMFDSTITEGHYYLKLDRPNAGGPPDLDEARDLDHAVRTMPRRNHFAAERRLQAAVEMFRENMELKTDGDHRLVLPENVPMISPDQLETFSFQPGGPRMPVVPTVISTKTFRNLAVGRLNAALRVKTGKYREIKTSFVTAFNVADKLLRRRDNAPLMLDSIMDRTLQSLKQSSLAHVAKLDKKQYQAGEVARDLNLALEALRTYYRHRNEDGSIQMFTPRPLKDTAEDQALAPKLQHAFANPMFSAIRGVPIQVLSEFWTTSDFPVDGLELFARARNK